VLFDECAWLPQPQKVYSKHHMRVFKDVGLVEQLGSGMSRILKAYDKPVFKILPNFIKLPSNSMISTLSCQEAI